MTILFFVSPYHGHINPALVMANQLRTKGYSIVFVGSIVLKEKVEKNAFSFCEIGCNTSSTAVSVRSLIGLLKNRKLNADFQKKNWMLFNLELKRVFNAYSPELVVVDNTCIPFALYSIKLYYKTVLFSVTLSDDYDDSIPPFCSSYIPKNNHLDKMYIDCIWSWWLFKRKLLRYIKHLILGKHDYLYIPQLLKKLNLSDHIIETKRVWDEGIKSIPELLLYPREFDFPRPYKLNRVFIGSTRYDRKEVVDFMWKPFTNTNPIVLFSLGTLSTSSVPDISSFYDKVFSVFSKEKNINFIVSTGGYDWNTNLPIHTDNIQVYKYVPQLLLLEKVSIMITHAGFNSVKECIHAGVPMLCLPLVESSDQYGCASRISYHKIGLVADYRKITRKPFLNRMREVLYNPIYKTNILKIKSVFDKKGSSEDLLEFTDRYLTT